MPWKVETAMSQRREFCALAALEGANFAQMCRQFGISRVSGYKWLKRYREEGAEGLLDQSRRPHQSPGRTAASVEQAIVALRDQHPAWGARKLRARLQALGQGELPAASTMQAILTRHGKIDPAESEKHQPWSRFERAAPNELWQMDFKGHFALSTGERCHPLTILDDHARFSLGLTACANEQAETVQRQLTAVFRRYGLPQRMLMDNGSPWSGGFEEPHSWLTLWLLRLDIGVSHGRPYHPQTQGKEERFHRTLNAEVLRGRTFASLPDCQRRFDAWREVYNFERPHQALNMAPPISRYTVSARSFPEELPELEFSSEDIVRKVSASGDASFRGQQIRLGKAFRGERVGFRATLTDGVWVVWYGHHEVGLVDLRVGRLAVPTVVRYAHSRRHSQAAEK